MAKVIKFTDFNISNFGAFLDNASIPKSSHCIDLGPELVYCKAFPLDSKFIKFTSINSADVVKFDGFPDGIKNIVLKYASLKKLTNAMAVFDVAGITKIEGDIHYDKSNLGEYYVCNHIQFRSGKTKLIVKCDEDSLIKYLPDQNWTHFSNRDEILCRFDIDADAMAQLSKLMNIDKQNAIIIHADVNKLTLKSKNIGEEVNMWDKDIDTNYQNMVGSQRAFTMSKALIADVANMPYYTVYVTKIKNHGNDVHVVQLWHNDSNIITAMVNVEI